MDCNLQGLYNSPEWRKNLHGYLAFNDGTELSYDFTSYFPMCIKINHEVTAMWAELASV